MSFVFLISLIFLNLFVAIILDGYFETRNDRQNMQKDELLENFRKGWSEFDADATGLIKVNEFPDLMFKIGAPLGWDASYEIN